MNTFWQGVVHILASMAGVTVSFAYIPAPYGIWVGAIWAGIVATAAFLNQSYAKSVVAATSTTAKA